MTIDIGDFNNLAAFDFSIAYNNSVLRIDGGEGGPGISAGLINSVAIPIDLWAFSPSGVQGKVGAVTRITKPVSGHGYLAVIHFTVVGSKGQSSSVAFASFSSIHKVDLLNGIDQSSMPYSFGAEQVRISVE